MEPILNKGGDEMLITLPENFQNKYSEVISNKLYLYNILSFEKLMYALTYEIYGDHCYLCGKSLNKKTLTIDHLFPRAIGGISITNNMRPCCSKCNSLKGSKTERQFLEMAVMKKREKKLYKLSLEVWKEQIYKTQGFYLPEHWINYININSITGIVNPNRTLGQKYEKYLDFFNKYGNLPKPIIVDLNFNLLDGRNVYSVAKEVNLKYVPIIWCKNVISELNF